jgi:hypothetical protein
MKLAHWFLFIIFSVAAGFGLMMASQSLFSKSYYFPGDDSGSGGYGSICASLTGCDGILGGYNVYDTGWPLYSKAFVKSSSPPSYSTNVRNLIIDWIFWTIMGGAILVFIYRVTKYAHHRH